MFKASRYFLSGHFFPEGIASSLWVVIGLETTGHSRIFIRVDKSLPLQPEKKIKEIY